MRPPGPWQPGPHPPRQPRLALRSLWLLQPRRRPGPRPTRPRPSRCPWGTAKRSSWSSCGRSRRNRARSPPAANPCGRLSPRTLACRSAPRHPRLLQPCRLELRPGPEPPRPRALAPTAAPSVTPPCSGNGSRPPRAATCASPTSRRPSQEGPTPCHLERQGRSPRLGRAAQDALLPAATWVLAPWHLQAFRGPKGRQSVAQGPCGGLNRG
mmetsp:Transcript_103314/g.333254  ORF Transcript_103314/g.333254 Transcript_103314/m.333254 type:complete len:211 (-) Transcript_103314:67-699(-)